VKTNAFPELHSLSLDSRAALASALHDPGRSVKDTLPETP